MKIVADIDIPFLKGVLEPYARMVYRDGSAISRADLCDADALIVRTRTVCDSTLLKGTRVRFIATATIGFDHIDREFCRLAGIDWASAPGCNASSVLQYVAAALGHLSGKREFALLGKTIGVVGVGNVGAQVVRFCERMGMRVLQNDPPRQRREKSSLFVSLETLLREADILTLHVPLNRDGEDRTFHLLDEERLKRLRPEQILMNTSRGEIVETEALKALLKRKGVAASVLDVWEGEPQIDRELLAMADLATSHIAGYSADGKANGTAMAVAAVSRFFGFPLTGWYPPDIPLPPHTKIDIDAKNLSPERVVHAAVRETYDIAADDRALRNSPEDFERLRSGYSLRREFPAYHVSLRNAGPEVATLLEKIGFETSGTHA